MFDEEITTEIAGWRVTYPASCNGRIADLGFVVRPNGFLTLYILIGMECLMARTCQKRQRPESVQCVIVT